MTLAAILILAGLLCGACTAYWRERNQCRARAKELVTAWNRARDADRERWELKQKLRSEIEQSRQRIAQLERARLPAWWWF